MGPLSRICSFQVQPFSTFQELPTPPHLGRTLSTKVALGRGRPWGKHYRKREQGSHPGKMKGKRWVSWGNFERNESKNLGGGSCFWMATPQFFEHQTLKMLPPFSFLGSPLDSQDTTELPVLHLPAGWFGAQVIPLSWQLGIQTGGIGMTQGYPRVTIPSIFGNPRNPNHRAPNHQFTIRRWIQSSKKT